MTLEDALARAEICNLVASYNLAGDQRQLEAFVDVFADDAVYESAVFRCVGRDEIHGYLAAAWGGESGRPMPKARRHHITTTRIDVHTPETASGLVYYLMCTDRGPDHGGFYVDRYRRTADGWRIASREVWMDWSRDDSLFVPEQSKRLVAEGRPCGPASAGG